MGKLTVGQNAVRSFHASTSMFYDRCILITHYRHFIVNKNFNN